jgi:hypothetical protein
MIMPDILEVVSRVYWSGFEGSSVLAMDLNLYTAFKRKPDTTFMLSTCKHPTPPARQQHPQFLQDESLDFRNGYIVSYGPLEFASAPLGACRQNQQVSGVGFGQN